MKLVTTYAALEILGPTYHWNTDLFADGDVVDGTLQGDLIFRSGGDPKLTLERMWLMLRDLKAAGIRHINGNLVLQPADMRFPADIPPFIDDSGNQNRPFLVEPDPLLTNLKVFVLSSFAEEGGVRINPIFIAQQMGRDTLNTALDQLASLAGEAARSLLHNRWAVTP